MLPTAIGDQQQINAPANASGKHGAEAAESVRMPTVLLHAPNSRVSRFISASRSEMSYSRLPAPLLPGERMLRNRIRIGVSRPIRRDHLAQQADGKKLAHR